jgi:quinol-cytochrome oxidoreductase complex cytochrome b subunit
VMGIAGGGDSLPTLNSSSSSSLFEQQSSSSEQDARDRRAGTAEAQDRKSSPHVTDRWSLFWWLKLSGLLTGLGGEGGCRLLTSLPSQLLVSSSACLLWGSWWWWWWELCMSSVVVAMVNVQAVLYSLNLVSETSLNSVVYVAAYFVCVCVCVCVCIIRRISGVQEHFRPLLYESEWHLSVAKLPLFIVLQTNRPTYYSMEE